MIDIKVSIDTSGVQRMLANAEKQLRYAAARGLTATAYDARTALQKEMAARLDRPTRWTLGGSRVEKATRDNLVAVLAMREGQFQPADQLRQQFAGGGRAPKRFEVALQRAGLIAGGERIVPGRAAQLDVYGNVRRGQLTQILQAIGAAKAKAPTKQKRTSRSARSEIFWSDGKAGPEKGAWLKKGKTLMSLLLVVSSTQYRQRLALRPLVERVVAERLQRNFDTALAEALRTAR